MNKQLQAWAGAGGVLIVFGVLGIRAPGMLGVTGTWKAVMTGGFVVIALALAVLTLLFLRARVRAKQDAEAASGAEDIDQLFAAAQKRLAEARLGKDARIGRLPLMLVIGPSGSTKTSVLTHSGLEPELLAGEVMRADAVVATDPLNVWYAQGTVVVEAGGRLLDDPQRWRRVMHHVRPSRVAAAFGRRQQAARYAVLCVGCDEFQKPGASQNLAAAARGIRTRLGEAAQLLGIRLPVYVLFTRSDRLPYFTEYVRSFTAEEAQQVLGATLPVNTDTSGAWAERESRRLNEAFARIVRALTTRRLDVLMRESEEATRAAAYEFPRELRRITEPAVQLLLDIFRPSQLSVHAFLRGFYFTGVRPIILRDLAGQKEPAAPSAAHASAATGVFSAAMIKEMQQVPVIAPSGRKVPQWVFVDRLFRDVVLADRTAAAITGGSARVDLLRRSLVGAVAATAVIATLGFTVSWRSNGGIIKRSSALAATAVSAPTGDARAEILVLDSLRQELTALRAHRRLTAGWGLSRRTPVHERMRRLYFEKFQNSMWGPTRASIITYLAGLPERPDSSSSYARAHNALAAYLLTTQEWQKEEPELLADAAMSFWRSEVSDDSLNLIAREQFRFFGEELPRGNPYDVSADARVVTRAQQFIRQFGPDAIYESLVAEIDREIEPVRWLEQTTVRNGKVVGGSYTIAGFRQMEARLDSLDAFIEKRAWLYGPQGPAHKPDPDSLRLAYEGHYIAEWQRFIEVANVVPFTSAADAAVRLASLASAGSPMFRMLQDVADNTNNPSLQAVHHAFGPLRAAVPPRSEGGPTSRVPGYTGILGSLSQQMQAAAMPGADGAIVQTIALQLSAEVTNIGRVERMNANAAQTLTLLHQLLRQPEERVTQALTELGPAKVNAAGAAFCTTYGAIEGRYPFNRSGADADVAAVIDMFRKEDGGLAAFLNETLGQYVTPTGARVPGAPAVNAGVLSFVRTASYFGDAVDSPAGATVRFNVFPQAYPAGLTEVALIVEGARQSWSTTELTRRWIDWPLGQYTQARLVLKIGANEVVVADPRPGPWAIFRLFDRAAWTQESNGRYNAKFMVPGQNTPLELSIGFAENRPVLIPAFLRPLATCPRQILD